MKTWCILIKNRICNYVQSDAIDASKVKGDTAFHKKCGHMMLYFTVGNAKLLQCVFCGNRVAEMIQS
jgi:uncharacterized protein YqhQ